MKTKNEIIKYLFARGYISIDAALELAADPLFVINQRNNDVYEKETNTQTTME